MEIYYKKKGHIIVNAGLLSQGNETHIKLCVSGESICGRDQRGLVHSLCTLENYLSRLDSQDFNKGIIGTVIIQDFCKTMYSDGTSIFQYFNFIVLVPAVNDLCLKNILSYKKFVSLQQKLRLWVLGTCLPACLVRTLLI